MNTKIQYAIAKKIEDSAKKPALEIELQLFEGKKVSASIGEGESRGRDEGGLENTREAIEHFAILEEKFLQLKDFNQQQFDENMLALYESKKIGINTALTASVAHLKAQAVSEGKQLWEIIQAVFDINAKLIKPSEICVLAEGGKHSQSAVKLGIQEISIIGLEKVQSAEQALIRALQENNIKFSSGLEGGIAPETDDIKMILTALKNFDLALDIASQTRLAKDDVSQLLSSGNVKIVEDPFDQNQANQWKELMQTAALVVADDLTVTRADLIQKYQDYFNAIIIKPTQAGTVTKTIEAVKLARQLGKKIIVSHRGRETTDDFLADFAIAINSDYVKFGNPSQKEREVKYKRMDTILAI